MGAGLLDIFDEKVRKAFYKRKEKWLGRRELGYEIPMLTAAVLNKCKSWQDLFKIVEDLRNTKNAIRFRASVSQLLAAVENRRNEEVDEIFAQLDAAVEEWSAALRMKRLKKKITVSIPVINIETDLEIPDMKLASTPGDKLLVFIHSLLAES